MEKGLFWRFQYALLVALWEKKRLSAGEFHAVASLLREKIQEKSDERR